jgi:hypothetical protein
MEIGLCQIFLSQMRLNSIYRRGWMCHSLRLRWLQITYVSVWKSLEIALWCCLIIDSSLVNASMWCIIFIDMFRQHDSLMVPYHRLQSLAPPTLPILPQPLVPFLSLARVCSTASHPFSSSSPLQHLLCRILTNLSPTSPSQRRSGL